MAYEKSFARRQLEERLTKAVDEESYEVITYASLNELIGGDVRNGYQQVLRAARFSVEREKNRLFICVPRAGIKLASVKEQSKEADAGIRQVRRTTKRRLSRLSHVQFDKLDEESKRAHTMASAVLGTMSLFASKQGVKKIAAAVVPGTVNVGQTLRLFVTESDKS